MPLRFASQDSPSVPLIPLRPDQIDEWCAAHPSSARWVETNGFAAKRGTILVLPGDAGEASGALLGLGTDAEMRRTRFALAAAAKALPAGIYHLDGSFKVDEASEFALGWLLESYRFDRYKDQSAPKAALKAPENVDAARIEAVAAAEALTRDLINTPAADMGPEGLEAAARELATAHGARIKVITGDQLIAQNFPMVHTVGRAAIEAPRLIDLTWGTTGPRLTLVGKGVSFDTGGLNLKPGASMALMKKDMGGAANVMGLAKMIMALELPLQLRVLVPAVENAIDGAAFRPGDILTSRKGLTVEINNTDAEGRLILADALALADEDKPDLIVSMATLTGAARVAVGPDLAPFYTDNDPAAAALSEAAAKVRDPVWRMPFWDPYEQMIEPGIADLDNAPKGGFAGSITAALFLRRFVTDSPYMHFDIYGWQPSDAPGRPKGGAAQGIRALLEAFPKILRL